MSRPYWKPLGGPGFELVERIERTIARYRMITQGDTVVVAVSGGPDSTCLLDVLARLGARLEVGLVVAHVDHGLSERSQEIAARVASEGAKEGFEVHLARASGLEGSNLQARARDFRYEFLDIVARREGAARIATGHTLDDRVETTLARLIHGAGTAGVAGLRPVDGSRVRPLIACRRFETRAYCEERGLNFYDDPANEDPRFERSFIRGELVARIEARWGDGAVRAIATAAERLDEDAQALEVLAHKLYDDVARREGDALLLDRATLASMSRAFQRRMLELAVGRVRDRSGGIDAAFDALAVPEEPGKSVRRFAVVSGIEIVVEPDVVRVLGAATDDDGDVAGSP